MSLASGTKLEPYESVARFDSDGVTRRAPRLDSVDLLRGLVMAFMALDHVRDFLTNNRFMPDDLSRTTPALFLTRWVTHFCAPTFIFLAGVGISLARQRGQSPGQLSRFLITRGLWLILLEFTVVRVAWDFNFKYNDGFLFAVLWVLGLSMIVLAGLIHLPRLFLAIIALGMIVSHNLFDDIHADRFGAFAPLWNFLHEPAFINKPNLKGFVLYPLIPWIGVMASGYLFGPLLALPSPLRRRRLLLLGASLILAFIIIRTINRFGDSHQWAHQSKAIFTAISYMNTTKYPPSLLFLLMTLGPAIAALAFFENARGPVARVLITIGRVPFFYYLLHIYLIHTICVMAGVAQGFDARQLMVDFIRLPEGFGFGLGVIYAVWIGVVLLLYIPCRWFAGVKARRRDAWLSYL